jgi:hypothetical protein
MNTDTFVKRENLKHLRDVLARTADEPERMRIMKMIEAEELKDDVKR